MDQRPPRPPIHNPNHQSSMQGPPPTQPTVYQPPSSQQPPVQIPFSDPFSHRRGPDPFMPSSQSQRRGSYGLPSGREPATVIHNERAPLAAPWPPTTGTSVLHKYGSISTREFSVFYFGTYALLIVSTLGLAWVPRCRLVLALPGWLLACDAMGEGPHATARSGTRDSKPMRLTWLSILCVRSVSDSGMSLAPACFVFACAFDLHLAGAAIAGLQTPGVACFAFCY